MNRKAAETIGDRSWAAVPPPQGGGGLPVGAAHASDSPERRDAGSFFGGLFAACAMLQVVYLVLLLSVFIVHKTYVADRPTTGGYLEASYSWLLLAALAWVLVNLAWAVQAMRRRKRDAYGIHLALAIACGWIVIGIQAVMFARSVTMQPLVLDYSTPGRRPAAAASAESSSAPAGDPKAGEKAFSTTCITCHGPRGEGLADLAPSLRASAFIASADDASVAAVIRQGRAVGDPNNKSGKMMPARGGNPFLSEEDISHLVAFVRLLSSGSPTASAGAEAGPNVSLARWVVPAAAPPPSGLALETVDLDDSAGLERMKRDAQRRQTLMRRLTLALTGVHGLFLLGVLTISSNWLLTGIWVRPAATRLLRTLSTGGWWIAAVAWVFVAWLCFWWR